MPRITNKITTKDLVIDKRALNKDGDSVMCGILGGTATGTRTYKSQYGDGFGLVGAFFMLSPDGSSRKDAGALYPPDVLLHTVVSKLEQENVNSVEFVGEIHAEYSESGVGYRFSFEPLTNDDTNDRLSQLADVAVKRLSPPKPKAKKED